ncbi:hypothetical protein [Priestia megaterium]|uniref:hypothetical protein n=1 Tax=Priestia megaterium TaxID=1404 RepID=UPI003BF9D1DC
MKDGTETVGQVFGMEIIEEVIVEGHNAMPDKTEEIIQEGLRQVTEVVSNMAEGTGILTP